MIKRCCSVSDFPTRRPPDSSLALAFATQSTQTDVHIDEMRSYMLIGRVISFTSRMNKRTQKGHVAYLRIQCIIRIDFEKVFIFRFDIGSAGQGC